MPSSTFETLPDEVLMMIVQYSGDIFTAFHAFLGLNQRINTILIDRRTRLLTNFLSMVHGDVNIDHYYNSVVFSEVTKKLFTLKSIDSVQELRPYLEQLVAFQLRQQYEKYTDELELGLVHHQCIRMELSSDEFEIVDVQLKEIFMSLQTSSNLMKTIDQILSLVLHKGARLECINYANNIFNFAEAVNILLIDKVNDRQPVSQHFINSLVRMFKMLLISNLNLLRNYCLGVNGGCVIYYYLFYTIYKCQSVNTNETSSFINIRYYRAIVDMLLFTLQCLHYESIDESWRIFDFADLLKLISIDQFNIYQKIFVHISQAEILKILFERNILNPPLSSADPPDTLWENISHLLTCDRLNLISTLFYNDEYIHHRFTNCWNDRKLMNFFTGTREKRQMLQSLFDNSEAGIWLITMTNLLFILLEKKECKLIKRLFNRCPSLVDRLDDEGNDPLLYLCLKVRGCRERLVEYLLTKGSNIQRRNIHGENFYDALNLNKNRDLLKKLNEQGIIENLTFY